MQTNTNKLIAWALMASVTLISSVHAATNIGTGSVVGSGGLTTSVVWNDTYTANSATGTVAGLAIKAKIQPTLNMTISGSGVIDLGLLSAASYNSGTVNIEVGTNAVNGTSVTASSVNAGLMNGTNKINNLTTDGIADSYMFSSISGSPSDSSFSGSMTQTFGAATEINSTTPFSIYTSNKPEKLDLINDIDFTVSAKPSAETPAGDYADQVNITITGNF